MNWLEVRSVRRFWSSRAGGKLLEGLEVGSFVASLKATLKMSLMEHFEMGLSAKVYVNQCFAKILKISEP